MREQIALHPYIPLHFREMIFPLVYRASTDALIGIGMVPSIIDVWGYDREFCSSSSFLRPT